MLDYGIKKDNDETSAGVVVAKEYNSLMQEQKNVVTPFFTPNELDNQQQVKAIDILSKAIFYNDVGSVNSVQLTRGATNQTLETYFDGMVVIFTPANDNTGATTIKINTFDTKPLKFNGSDLEAGYLNTGSKYIAIYNQAQDRFDVDVLTGGSAKQRFKVADAQNDDEAVSKGQLLGVGNKEVLIYGLSNNTTAQNGVTTKIPFDYEIENTFGDAIFDSSNKRFVIQKAGTYYIKSSVRTNCGGSTPRVDLAIFKNSSAFISNGFNQDSGGCGNWGAMVDSVVKLNKDDYIEIYYNQNSGDDLTVYGTNSGGIGNTGGVVTYINIARIGD